MEVDVKSKGMIRILDKSRISRSRFPGLFVSLILGIAAYRLGEWVPLVGAPVFGILLGVLFRACIGAGAANDNLQLGIRFTSKNVLQFAIILLGAGLNIQTIFHVGSHSFLVMIGTLLVALIGGHLIGRIMRIPHNMITLIAAGTGICGASAISSLSPILEASEAEISYSISTIFLFNVIAVFVFPFLGHVLHMKNQAFGIWAGTAVNDTSSVVAAGYAYSDAAGQYATIVKLTRSLMIIPVCLFFMVQMLMKSRQDQKKSIRIPWFIIGFLVMSALGTIGLFGQNGNLLISKAGQFLVIIALAAVGLGADLRSLAKTGIRPMLLGLFTWILVAVSSIVLQKLTGQL